MLAALISASALGQQLSFKDNSSLSASPTSRAHVYSLQEATNLTDNSWAETQSQRGSDTNLSFSIEKDLPTKFFRTVSNYQPVDPTNIVHSLNRGDRGLGTTVFSDNVVNYSSNVDVNVTWVETYNPTYASYNVDFSFTQPLTNGINTIKTTFSNIGLGTGQRMEGYLNLEVSE